MALGSLGFSLVSSLLLTITHLLFGWFVSLTPLVANPGGYARQHLPLILSTVVVELVVACALAVGLDAVLAKRGREVSSVRQQSAWRQVFRDDRPRGSVPWVHVQLTDGSAYLGYLRAHTAAGNPDEREIILEGGGMTYLAADAEPKAIGEKWPRVVIPSSQIKSIWLQYRDHETGELIQPAVRGRQAVRMEA